MKIHGNKDIDDKQSKIHLKNTIDELTRHLMTILQNGRQ
jgi:hypothetical protein